MNKQLLATKDTDRYPSQALSSDCCNIALWEAGQKKQTDPNWKRSTMDVSARCGLTMWDVAEKRITNEHVRGMVANSPTMDTLMETRRCRWLSKLSAMKSQDLRGEYGAWCTTARPVGRPQQTIRHAHVLKKARL
jgi:hypothetical protein